MDPKKRIGLMLYGVIKRKKTSILHMGGGLNVDCSKMEERA